MATRPGVSRAIQGPTLDPGLLLGVCVDRAAELVATSRNSGLCGNAHATARLAGVRLLSLQNNVFTVRLLHGAVAIAMEHDDRNRLNGLPAGAACSAALPSNGLQLWV